MVESSDGLVSRAAKTALKLFGFWGRV